MDFAAPFFETEVSYGLLVLRAGLAVVIFAHGAQNSFAQKIRFYTNSLHISYLSALVVVLICFLAPIAVFFGFFTRLAALALVIQFIVTAPPPGDYFPGMRNQKGGDYEFHILVITCAFSLMIMGCGPWGIDRWIARELL
jgi:putative oxidoreductase